MRPRKLHERDPDPAISDGGMRITDAEFASFRDLVRHTAGITLADTKRQLLCSRLARRLRHHRLQTYSEYYEYLRTRDPAGDELREMINCITTNKTHFFREPHHFDFLRERVFPEIAARSADSERHRLRIWSAGCSTGEEPYSIAMTVAEHAKPLSRWDVKILASDIDTNVLAHAEAGIYASDGVAELSASRQRQWFQPVAGEPGLISPKEQLRQLLIFRRINLIQADWPINTSFDVIFCRNVTIYFDRETQERLYRRFARLLRPGGYLIAGHSENLSWLGRLFVGVGKTVYRLHPEFDSAERVVPFAATPQRGSRTLRTAVPNYPRAPVKAGKVVDVISGGVFASREPATVCTLLGSCVSVCLHDPLVHVGGMNHFMLPDNPHRSIESAAYGVHAMELLINEMMAIGAQRSRLQARVFGGANVLRDGRTQVAESNARFALEFLAREGISVLEKQLGGEQPRRITLQTYSGAVGVRVMGEERQRVLESEAQRALEIKRDLARAARSKVTLF